MRIIITADLHYEPARRSLYQDFARDIVSQQPDCFILAGDAGHPLRLFRRCLQLFSDLTLQLIRWFVTKKEYESIARGLLDAILGGLESVDNGKLREVYALIALPVPECILLTVFVLVVAAGLLEVPC